MELILLKAGNFYSMKIDNSSIDRAEQCKYLETKLTDPNSI